MCLLFLVPVDFISHIPWNTFIFSFLKEKSKPKPKLSEAPHPAPLSSAFSVLPPGLLILAASLSSFLSSTQCVLAGQDRLFSRLGVYLAIWLSAWDSKYFPIRKHYTSVLPILLLPSSKTLWFFPPPAVLWASTPNQEQLWLCSGVGWRCRAPVSLHCWDQDSVK